MTVQLARLAALLLIAFVLPASGLLAADADLVLHNGKIVTVDKKFSVQQALAVQNGKIVRVGTNDDVLKLKGPKTTVVDLKGQTVIPGLIDSHVHPNQACMSEFDHAVPDFESIEDVFKYVRERAKVVPKGEWIDVKYVFITRLKDPRYPTKAELDAAAPDHPVVFITGVDAVLNNLALKKAKIDKDFKVTDGGAGYAEKDKDGNLTGVLRGCHNRYVKYQPTGKQPTELDRTERLLKLLRDYNSIGLTTIGDRKFNSDDIERYRKLHEKELLPIRVRISPYIESAGDTELIRKKIRKVGEDPLCKGSDMLQIIGIKTMLDGGMLTGTAYMQEPWGTSKIYGIDDPKYRGLLMIPKDRLRAMVETAHDAGLQFTAHSVGDGAVHALLEVYEELDRTKPVKKHRPCLTHANWWVKEDIAKAARLGVIADVQPIWLHLDSRTLLQQFGNDRLRWFQPLKSLTDAGVLLGGGSDHMQKIGSLRAINPYNPFQGIWIAVTREAKWQEKSIHIEESLSREQALRLYTINNARLLFLEDQVGSLEEGKLADFVVLDRDILKCPVAEMKDIQAVRTFVNGKLVYERK